LNAASPQLRNLLNFSGGPGALPESVLAQVQASIQCVPGVGLSILGISHRSSWFIDLVLDTEERVKRLLGMPKTYRVLLLQGGATQQFATISMAFNRCADHPAQYLDTGYWSHKSIEAARTPPFPELDVVWSGQGENYSQLPSNSELESKLNPNAPYFHYVSNETVEGMQFHEIMGLDGVDRICDMSSDFLSRPLDAERFSLIYAHAQKNLGPAGVTLVLIKESMLHKMPDEFAAFLDYRVQAQAHSNFNTPPVFAIYVVNLVLRWLEHEVGGLPAMQLINEEKARLLYSCIDEHAKTYQNLIPSPSRSMMNVTFGLKTPELEERFLQLAKDRGFSGLSGHRSRGAFRASLYNGVTVQAVHALCALMQEFAASH
jgi:phosphoserine aminotransferase